jgi:hypothetical protein
MRSLQVERALPAGGFLPRGALEGVVAAGGTLDGAFAELHRRFHRVDLQAGDWGEAGFFVQARRGGLGYHGFGGFGQRKEHAAPGAFAFNDAFQVAWTAGKVSRRTVRMSP